MALDGNLEGPKFVQLFHPVLVALRELGGSARPAEVVEKLAENLDLSDDQLAESLPSGTSRFNNLVAWARFYLAKTGHIDSSRRGVWTLTEKGERASFTHAQALALFRETHKQFQGADDEDAVDDAGENVTAPQDDLATTSSYRDEVLGVLRRLSPGGFERFCQRLLRESGFQDVTVTGRSNDGGIDGIGILQVNPLVSFKVLFQCKRYSGSVSPSQVRDFRGAMTGRADKGLIITTGTFTKEARREAVRDGAPPVELVDGEKLVTMLEELELGLVPVKAYRVEASFFEDFA